MSGNVPALIICSESPERERIGEVVRRCGMRAVHCPTLADACSMLTEKIFALVICSDSLPDSNLHASLQSLSGASSGAPVIAISRHAEWEACLAAIDAGAFDYLAMPVQAREAERVVRGALEHTGRHRQIMHSAA